MDVLLVEDDEITRAVLAEALTDAGMRVTDVSGPSAALDLANAGKPPAVLVTDVNLGVAMDGFALAAAARQRWPEICVVVMSGRPDNLDGHQLYPWGRFLPKPFLGSDLLRVIGDLVRRKPPDPDGLKNSGCDLGPQQYPDGRVCCGTST